MISKEELSYIAGHFDGEGCITMVRHKSYYAARIIVGCCYLPILETYAQHFGGNLQVHGCRNNSHRTHHSWTLCDMEGVLFFLASVMPFLREKHDQAEVMARYLLVRTQYPKNTIPSDVVELGHWSADMLRKLKRVNYA